MASKGESGLWLIETKEHGSFIIWSEPYGISQKAAIRKFSPAIQGLRQADSRGRSSAAYMPGPGLLDQGTGAGV